MAEGNGDGSAFYLEQTCSHALTLQPKWLPNLCLAESVCSLQSLGIEDLS